MPKRETMRCPVETRHCHLDKCIVVQKELDIRLTVHVPINENQVTLIAGTNCRKSCAHKSDLESRECILPGNPPKLSDMRVGNNG
jgi:hypothetical protein